MIYFLAAVVLIAIGTWLDIRRIDKVRDQGKPRGRRW